MTDTKDKSLVKSTGRGVIYITFAKMWFMLTGAAMTFILPRVFKLSVGGDDELGMKLYGLYGLVFTGISFVNNGIITGAIQSVSKFTSEDESTAGAVRKTGLMVLGGTGLVLGLLYAGVSYALAIFWFENPSLELLMPLSSGVIVAYSCYAVFIGSFNGIRNYHKQAGFDIVFATMKTAIIILMVFLGFQVLGTVVGFLLAATVITIAAGFLSRIKATGTFPAARFIVFARAILIYSFVLNLLMMLDIYLLAGLIRKMAVEGLSGTAAAEAATKLSEMRCGQYKAVQNFAFIPYQAVIAIAFVVFPMISKVTHMAEDEKAKIYVQKTFRFTGMLIAVLASIFIALPEQAMGLMFPPEYVEAFPALRILSIGITAFGLMVVGNTLLNGAGHPWRALTVVLAGLVAMVIAVPLLVNLAGPGPESLTAAASGTAIGMGVALTVCGFLVQKRFGTFWPWKNMIRILIASLVAITAGYFMPTAGKLFTLIECIAVAVVFFVTLVAIREIGKEDLGYIRQVLKKG